MASTTSNTHDHTTEVVEYYCTAVGRETQHCFQNLDDSTKVGSLVAAVQNSKTQNFVLDFSDTTSYVAFDATMPVVAALLETDRPEALNTRWINIWYASQQKPLLELLAQRYDFSPRLLALMCSDPKRPRQSQSSTQQRRHSSKRVWHGRNQVLSVDSEVEKGLAELSEYSSTSSYDSVVSGDLYNIIDELWHYTSVDFGRNYVCIGYNSLYGTKHAERAEPDKGLLPHCTRVWTWLILCEDNTIISIHEDPFPFSAGSLDPMQQRILAETRRNLTNVFRSLSIVQEEPSNAHAPMALLPLRARVGDTLEETVHRLSDTPGLLFYYLFENWQNSYKLVSRRESRYGVELNKVRAEMFELPKLCHIDRLDSIGQELGILRRHYESYNRIIDRLLEPQKATAASRQNSEIVSEASQASLDTVRPILTERESMLGVSLTSAARVRFKRLRDLIDLYALSEVEEYIKQKDSLVAMNFNLIAIKESLDVEKLTRITLLLTKVTVIFLPVSLMMAYFSVELVNMSYTITEFWISFTITLCLSTMALFIFGLVSGTVQMVPLWKDITRWIRSRTSAG